jgi:hypothetical protein
LLAVLAAPAAGTRAQERSTPALFYTWRALVTPRSGKGYELRALALLPAPRGASLRGFVSGRSVVAAHPVA